MSGHCAYPESDTCYLYHSFESQMVRQSWLEADLQIRTLGTRGSPGFSGSAGVASRLPRTFWAHGF